ncbi:hypothetical protein C4D60_Mb09t09160 [Musa balbisiana]|uniref:Uncharacterized protein n=1 Tax=Musa balbisiana TaxID=52838 RepID=A0A4S8IHJ4_MUSBA|nr:hypothetical protein C4D60_Mb09t09160 [Musa balbisiana]
MDGAVFFFLLDQIGVDLSSPILLRFVLHLFSWIRPAMALKSSASDPTTSFDPVLQLTVLMLTWDILDVYILSVPITY